MNGSWFVEQSVQAYQRITKTESSLQVINPMWRNASIHLLPTGTLSLFSPAQISFTPCGPPLHKNLMQLTWKSCGLFTSRWRLCALASFWRRLTGIPEAEETPAEPLWPPSGKVSSPSAPPPPPPPKKQKDRTSWQNTYMPLIRFVYCIF